MTRAETKAIRHWKENIQRNNNEREVIMEAMREMYFRAGGGELPDGYDIYKEMDEHLRYLLTSEDEDTRDAALSAYRAHERACAKYNAMIDLEIEFRSVGIMI